MQTDIYLSIGSNVGDRILNLTSAITFLKDEVEIIQVSGIYQTEPADYEDQDDFYNLALHGKTNLSPLELLETIKKIENKMGRQKTIRYGPRLIDIDIIYYGNEVIDIPELTLPHSRMQDRKFVLIPLMELDQVPEHPILKKSLAELVELATDLRVIPIGFD